jgi:hypothetical protein
MPALRARYGRVSWTFWPYSNDAIILFYLPAAAPAGAGGGNCWPNGNVVRTPVTAPPPEFADGWPAGTQSCVDVSWRALVLQGGTGEGCDYAFGSAMEMAVPVADCGAVVDALIAGQAALQATYVWDNGRLAQSDVRYVAGDDAWLSPFYGRDSCVISTSMLGDVARRWTGDPGQTRAFLMLLQDAAGAHGGRPHPGKISYLAAAGLAAVYPRYCDFLAVRHAVDPAGRWANEWLDALFPPAGSADAQQLCGTTQAGGGGAGGNGTSAGGSTDNGGAAGDGGGGTGGGGNGGAPDDGGAGGGAPGGDGGGAPGTNGPDGNVEGTGDPAAGGDGNGGGSGGGSPSPGGSISSASSGSAGLPQPAIMMIGVVAGALVGVAIAAVAAAFGVRKWRQARLDSQGSARAAGQRALAGSGAGSRAAHAAPPRRAAAGAAAVPARTTAQGAAGTSGVAATVPLRSARGALRQRTPAGDGGPSLRSPAAAV